MSKPNKARISKLTLVDSKKIEKLNLNLCRECKVLIENNCESKEEIIVKFDDLEKKELLGKGYFGTVLRMLHRPSNTIFAVKSIDENQIEASDKKNEVMDLKALLKIGNQCPNLIKFYGAIHAESAIWILTEEMNTSLDRFYPKVFYLETEMPELFISKVAQAVSEALYFLKQIKMLHRDIKPSNILINYNGEIKVCDLGICGFTNNSVSESIGKGCQSYMAPEKIDLSLTGGQHSIKSDIYSLGISLVEIATGYHPLNGSTELLAMIKIVISNDPPKLDDSKYSRELCDLVEKCLIKYPEDRISCLELLNHEFIKKYLETPNDLEFIKKIIDEKDSDIDDY